jgi:hypothetical protein
LLSHLIVLLEVDVEVEVRGGALSDGWCVGDAMLCMPQDAGVLELATDGLRKVGERGVKEDEEDEVGLRGSVGQLSEGAVDCEGETWA